MAYRVAGGAPWAHRRRGECPVERITCSAAGLRDQVYRSTVVVIDLWPSQRDTSEIGTPSASAVLAKVCRRSMSGHLRKASVAIDG
jgi:hypothetical protein